MSSSEQPITHTADHSYDSDDCEDAIYDRYDDYADMTLNNSKKSCKREQIYSQKHIRISEKTKNKSKG